MRAPSRNRPTNPPCHPHIRRQPRIMPYMPRPRKFIIFGGGGEKEALLGGATMDPRPRKFIIFGGGGEKEALLGGATMDPRPRVFCDVLVLVALGGALRVSSGFNP
jgi:hypothetical protein